MLLLAVVLLLTVTVRIVILLGSLLFQQTVHLVDEGRELGEALLQSAIVPVETAVLRHAPVLLAAHGVERVLAKLRYCALVPDRGIHLRVDAPQDPFHVVQVLRQLIHHQRDVPHHVTNLLRPPTSALGIHQDGVEVGGPGTRRRFLFGEPRQEAARECHHVAQRLEGFRAHYHIHGRIIRGRLAKLSHARRQAKNTQLYQKTHSCTFLSSQHKNTNTGKT